MLEFVNNITKLQFETEFPKHVVIIMLCSHRLSVSGNSEIMYSGILLLVMLNDA